VVATWESRTPPDLMVKALVLARAPGPLHLELASPARA